MILQQLKKFILRRVSKVKRRRRPKYLKFKSSSKVLNGLVAYNEYGGYFTPLSSQSRPAIQHVLKGKVYESDTIKLIIDRCGDGDVVHAGTFFGDFLPGISAALSTNAKIWAFEPNVENFRCAQITILINGLKNVNLMNHAVSDSQTIVKLLVESSTGMSLGGASKIIKENKELGKTADVISIRIDDQVPSNRKVSIIQLDVEGFEKEALLGAAETIKRCKPILILEDNNNLIESNWFSENLAVWGYKIEGKVHQNTVLSVN
jgi:FkbM family methyltransferase